MKTAKPKTNKRKPQANGAADSVQRLLPRSKVKPRDQWDLSSLFPDDDAWERAFVAWDARIDDYQAHAHSIDDSAEALAACLSFDSDLEREGERLGNYAFLKSAEDTANSTYQRMQGRFKSSASRAEQAASFIRPAILAIEPARLRRYLKAIELEPFRLLIERILRYREHTLNDSEEKLLAMQSEMADTAQQTFRQLNNADLKFGLVRNDQGRKIELSHGSFATLLHSPKRGVRRAAFHQYYRQFAAHENTLAATLAGSIQGDVYYARARGYASSLDAALFPDNVSRAVYDNLIAAVHRHLPALYRYYELRRKRMRLAEIHHYDTYVPILSELETRHPWRAAVDLVLASLTPLGEEYCTVLRGGLQGRWCDRYENQGKQSGAFSSGGFDGSPYILMNYQENVLDHVFTLAHEAGHSMHTWYSARSQPFPYYHYKIFVAEVASTFNEQLLGHHLRTRAKSDRERAYLINREIDAIRGTILRQTMFAEFELQTHELCERHEPLTVDCFKQTYRKLLELYFGPDFTLDPELSLECFRIPHFYRAFYVYKYATGLSAAIALAQRVTQGGPAELNDYLGFLRGGCSRDPLDLLRGAGVDMDSPEPVETALTYFGQLVDELEALLDQDL